MTTDNHHEPGESHGTDSPTEPSEETNPVDNLLSDSCSLKL